MSAEDHPEETILHLIRDYTEKSDAVIGAVDREATRPFKAQLAKLGGKFNMSLKDDRSGERTPGWIFSIKASDEADLQGFVDRVNSGEIEGDSSGGERPERGERNSGRRNSGKRSDRPERSERNYNVRRSNNKDDEDDVDHRKKKETVMKKQKEPETPQSIDVKVSPADFESIRRKKKSSVMIYVNKKISIVPGYSFNLVEYDTENPEEDNLIRLRKTTTMVVTSQRLKSIKDNIINDNTVISLDIPSDSGSDSDPAEGYWFVLYF